VFIPVPDGIRVVFRFILRGQPVTITIWVTTENEITETFLGVLADACLAWWDAGGKAAFSNELYLSTVEATQQNVQNGFQVTAVNDPPIAGGIVASAMPNNVAVVTTFRTSQIGRSHRGRVFLPGVASNDVSGSNVISGAVTDFDDAMTDLLATMVTAGCTPVVVSKYHEGAARTTAVVTPITTIQVRSRVDTQRRRLPKETS